MGIESRMPRIGRIYQRALCYHVMNRGVNRNQIYEDDQDRACFSRLVGEYKVEGARALGSRAFASTLKMERGRYRVRCGKPGKRARMNL